MNTVAFFGSPADMMVIAVLALLIFGPKKLPELFGQLGHAMREFRKISDEVTGAVHSVQGEVESVYKPIVLPPAVSTHTSSATVEQAVTHGPLDQEPDALLPKVPELVHAAPVPVSADTHSKEN